MMKLLTYSLFGLLFISTVVLAGDPSMFEHTKTYCFGRYLVDIPTEAVLTTQGNSYLVSSIRITKMPTNTLLEQAQKKETQLKAEKDPYENQYVTTKFVNSDTTRMLIAKSEPFHRLMYAISTYKAIGHGYVVTTSDESLNKAYIDETIRDYEQFLNQVRYRPTNQIPNEPGFCFENGFVANDGKQSQVERATLSFTLKNHPDVWVNIESVVYFKQQASLLARVKAAGVEKKFPGRVTIVSQQGRDVNQMNGEESLQYGQLDGGKGLTHAFAWETLGMVGDPLHASVHLDINTGADIGGNEVGASLTTPEVKALYETIVKTIRLRPTGGDTKPTTSGPQPKPAAQLPIGSKAASGSTCPQTGTWRCEQATAQDPERHFMAGQTLPPVMVTVKRNLWQTLKGGAEQVAQDTNWVLIQHDDAG